MRKKDCYKFDSAEDAINAANEVKSKAFNRAVENVEDTDEVIAMSNANVKIKSKPKKSTLSTGNYKKAIFTDEQKIEFLNELSNHGVVKHACTKAGISRLTFYYSYQSDEDFRRLVDDAMVLGAVNIEDEAKIRAVEGVEEDIYFKGEVVGTIRKFSDFLLVFLLKGNFPHKYNNTATSEEVSSNIFGQQKVNINAAVKSTDAREINYASLTDEQLRNLVASSVSTN